MKKIKLISSLVVGLSLIIIGTGCNENKNIDIVNIPFKTLDKNDFTLEDISKKIESPIIAATSDDGDLKKAYSKIRNNEETAKKITIDEEKELALIVFRGTKGNCKTADIDIEKIYRQKNTIKVEIIQDKNLPADINPCEILINPYMIIKLNKEEIKYDKGLDVELINNETKEIIQTTSINKLPSILK